jgi:hypothetical protein
MNFPSQFIKCEWQIQKNKLLWANLTTYMVLHAYFLPCCNDCIIWEIGDNVNIMGEYADTQDKVCG